MTYKLSDKEIEVMLSRTIKERYEYFIKRVVGEEKAWALSDENGFAMSSYENEKLLLPLWPFKEYALLCKTGDWKDCELALITLSDLIEELLPNLESDGIDISVFPTNQYSGMISASSLLKDLIQENYKYE